MPSEARRKFFSSLCPRDRLSHLVIFNFGIFLKFGLAGFFFRKVWLDFFFLEVGLAGFFIFPMWSGRIFFLQNAPLPPWMINGRPLREWTFIIGGGDYENF